MTQAKDQGTYDPLFGGGKSATFLKVGQSYTGTILSAPREMQQRDIKTNDPQFYDDGNPKMQTVVEIQTDERDPEDEADDGVRVVYFKGQRLGALRTAIRTARLKSRADLVGATLTVTFTKQEKAAERGLSGKKIFEVKVTPGQPAAETATDASDPWAE